MAPHKKPKSLRRCCMIFLARNWDLICYSVHSPREMAELLESDGYLDFEGPFIDFPSTVLEDLMEVIRAKTNLTRKFLHLLLKEQLLKLNLSLGVGEIYYGLQFLPRCPRLRDLNLSYLRHVEASHIAPYVQYLTSIVSLNLAMSSATDQLVEKIAEHCPNLIELNIQGTYVSDEGLRSLCGISCGGEPGCKRLQRLIVSETRTTWVGAYDVLRNLPNITDFDFDKIFQVFEHLDPFSVTSVSKLKLKSMFSSTPSIRQESIDAAATLCPDVEILAVMNTWINNETFYKFMQFENLRSLSIFNSEGKTIEYDEGVLPVLQVVGPLLENLILSKFDSLDLLSLGRSCPRLKKLALSGVKEIDANLTCESEEMFSRLVNLELWLEEDVNNASHNVLLQLLRNALRIENLLFRKSNALSINLLQQIWKQNPMRRLSRILLDQCNEICLEALVEILCMPNELSTFRVWSCKKIATQEKTFLQNIIKTSNLDVYLEWFE